MSRRRALRAAVMAVALTAVPLGCRNGKNEVGAQAVTPGAEARPAAGPTAIIDTGQRRAVFRIEIARTPSEHMRGLMYRDSLAADAGMLFIFDQPAVQTFWMKNTRIPLDMIFIGSDRRIVGVVENAEPLTLTGRSVGRPSQYVLEIGGGEAAKLGIHTGQAVDLDDVLPAP